MVQQRFFVVLILCLCFVMFPSQWANAQGQRTLAERQHLRMGVETGDLTSLDPVNVTTSGTIPLLNYIYSGLVRFPSGQVTPDRYEPDLAERWENSTDGLKWTFYLKKGVKWHRNFGEVTSDDVKFSIERTKKSFCIFHKNYQDIKEVNIIDKYVVQVVLNKPDAFFLSKVCDFEGGYITCKKALTEAGAAERPVKPTQKEVIGTGGFMFESYTPKEKTVLMRNNDYHRGKPIIERITVLYMPLMTTRELALLKKEVDMIRGDMQQSWVDMIRNKGISVDCVGPTIGNVVHINTTKKPFDDIRVRKALCYALDRKQVALYFGKDISQPLLSPIPTGYYGHVSTGIPYYEHNPEMAKKLLSEAGYSKGFEIELFTSAWKEFADLYKILQEQMRAVGIIAKFKEVEHSQYHAQIRKDLNPIVDYGFKKFPVADGFLLDFYHSASIVGKPTATTNFSHYDKIDDLIEKAVAELDLKKKLVLYAECQKRILEDCVAYPLVTLVAPLARQPYVDLGYQMKDTLTYSYIIDPKTAILKH